MTDKTLDQLTAGSAIVDADLFLTLQNGTTDARTVTGTQVKTYLSAPSKTQTFAFTINVEGPTNKTYTLIYQCPFAGTITTTKTISASGTATATFKVNTTALGGAANSVSSAGDSVTQSTSNTFAAGDKIVVTISANSSCVDFSGVVIYTRTLA